ncbi:MAG: V-type ATP synthase subunit B [Candidatus Helarchaeota archaeon]
MEAMTFKQSIRIVGPLIFMKSIPDVGYDEVVEIESHGTIQKGKVLEVGTEFIIVEVFRGTYGISLPDSEIRFKGRPFEIYVSEEMLGRIFNGMCEPIDGGPELLSGILRDVNSSPINPSVREFPRESIQTGISAIDGLATLIRGQKLPLFSGSGLPHSKLAIQIANQATIKTEEEFAIVFGAMGLKHSTADFYMKSFETLGAFDNVIMILNLAEDPPTERLIVPRIALTIAEYLAYEKDMHVLAILTDMTAYAEALREISSSKGEIPSRKGYPGYLYTDFATIYERAGRIKGKKGSITQIPILTMPGDDLSHPVPDLTGYITEGQILLERDLFYRNIYPPINILPSLSRLMKTGVGEGMTREDHMDVANQLYTSYTKAREVESLAKIVGEDGLSPVERKYLRFKEMFETKFINQDFIENRTFEETLDLAWKTLRILPETELSRIKEKFIQKYLKNE